MRGFERASAHAEKELNVRSKWIMCILRDMDPDSAMEHYEAALKYRHMIVGLGLDSDSYKRPPSLFENVWSRARADGFFKLTAHCDDGAREDVHEHIREACCSMGGTGADRIDHGIDAANSPELLELIKQRDLGLTLCPCAYLRHGPAEPIFAKIKTLYHTGVKFMIGSDDPAYMDDNWQVHNMLWVQSRCGFDHEDMAKLARNAVDMCWASPEVKETILKEIDQVLRGYTDQV